MGELKSNYKVVTYKLRTNFLVWIATEMAKIPVAKYYVNGKLKETITFADLCKSIMEKGA